MWFYVERQQIGREWHTTGWVVSLDGDGLSRFSLRREIQWLRAGLSDARVGHLLQAESEADLAVTHTALFPDAWARLARWTEACG